MKTIRRRLTDLGRFKVYDAQSTIYVETEDESADMDEAYARMQKVFGIAALSRAAVCGKNFDEICAVAKEYLAETLQGAKTFKVVARRSDKTFPMTSMELACELGAALLDAFPHLTVDVHHPDCQVFVEVRDYAAYVQPDKVKGAGGMPTSTSGKALSLIHISVQQIVDGRWRYSGGDGQRDRRVFGGLRVAQWKDEAQAREEIKALVADYYHQFKERKKAVSYTHLDVYKRQPVGHRTM